MQLGLLRLWLLVSLLGIFTAATANQELGDTNFQASSRQLESHAALATSRIARIQSRRLFQENDKKSKKRDSEVENDDSNSPSDSKENGNAEKSSSSKKSSDPKEPVDIEESDDTEIKNDLEELSDSEEPSSSKKTRKKKSGDAEEETKTNELQDSEEPIGLDEENESDDPKDLEEASDSKEPKGKKKVEKADNDDNLEDLEEIDDSKKSGDSKKTKTAEKSDTIEKESTSEESGDLEEIGDFEESENGEDSTGEEKSRASKKRSKRKKSSDSEEETSSEEIEDSEEVALVSSDALDEEKSESTIKDKTPKKKKRKSKRAKKGKKNQPEEEEPEEGEPEEEELEEEEPEEEEPEEEEPEEEEPKEKEPKKVVPPSDCVWVEDICAVRKEVASEIFSSTKSDVGKTVLKQMECSASSKEGDCLESNGCAWDPSTRKCDSIEYIGKEQDCFENSSVPLGIFADECGKKHSSQGSCVQDDTCLWDTKADSCRIDVEKTILGFSTAGEMANQVKSSRRAALDAEFNSNLVSFISSPDAILTWEFKELSCPVEASDTLCEYVATLDLAFIQNKYCSAKFDITEISSCNMDPLCNIGRTAACELSEKARAAVDEGAVQFLLSSAKSQEERDLLSLPAECSQRPNEECTESCFLRKNAGCIANFKEAAKKILQESKDVNSKECAPFLTVFMSTGSKRGKLKGVEPIRCSKQDSVCDSSEALTLKNALLEIDATVNAKMTGLIKKCGSRDTRLKCMVAK